MRIPHWVIILVGLGTAACESSPRAKPPTTTAPEATATAEVSLDATELVEVAQRLRDRDFDAQPSVVAGDVDGAKPRGCEATCAQERTLLQKILLAGDLPVEPAPLARYDATSNTVVYDSSHGEAALRAAVLAELVVALDDGAPIQARTWDEYLTARALRRGGGVFVAALDRATQIAPHVDASRLAGRPDALLQLGIVAARFADNFASREGFAFAAAMIRSGGWSTYELAHTEPPTTSHEIVRPDRYLSGEQAGTWTLPDELSTTRVEAGFSVQAEGHVGPAIVAEWFARRIPAAAARGVYVAYESDAYVSYQGPGDSWAFDWVSMWNDPTAAEQVAEAVEASLADRQDGAKFVVLRTGNVVGVVGQSAEVAIDLAALSTAVAAAKITFGGARPRGVPFVATALDRISNRKPLQTVPRTMWTDTATGTSLDLGALSDRWQLIATTEPNLPWFGKHESGAVLQYLVEPPNLLDPAPTDDAFVATVQKRFAQSIDAKETLQVKRIDDPLPRTTMVDAEGPIRDRSADGPVHLRAWLFFSGDAVTTLSLQAPPAQFEAVMDSVRPLLASLSMPQPAAAKNDGIVTFEVED